eukprot:gene6402-11488_t
MVGMDGAKRATRPIGAEYCRRARVESTPGAVLVGDAPGVPELGGDDRRCGGVPS